MTEMIEYRIRPVTRYSVTRWYVSEHAGGCATKGEFDSALAAYEVAYALCRDEHQRLGYPLDDGRIKYPEHPDSIAATRVEPSPNA